MKKVIGFLLLSVLALTASNGFAFTVKTVPNVIDLSSAGTTADVQIIVEGIADMGGFQFDMTYDPAVVMIDKKEDVRLGNFPKSAGGTVTPLGPVIDNSAGKLTFGAFMFGVDSGASGGGELAAIRFTVKKISAGVLNLENLQFANLKDGSRMIPDRIENTILTDGAPMTHVVTFAAEPHGTLVGAEVQTVEIGGSTEPVTAYPHNGYRFAGWIGDYTGSENPLVISNIVRNMSVAAHFEVIEVQPEERFYTAVFTAADGGSVAGLTNQTVKQGDPCNPVTAVPSEGFAFTGWSGDFTGAENPLTLQNVIKDMKVTAKFDPIPEGTFTVTFTSELNGSLSGDMIQFVNKNGTSRAVTAVADDGYRFAAWTGDYTGTDNPLALSNVSKHMTVAAVFEKIVYAIDVQITGDGSAAPSGRADIPHGGSQEVVFTPAEGNVIADVKVDALSIGAVRNYQFEHITSNHVIAVEFAKKSDTAADDSDTSPGSDSGGGSSCFINALF